MTDRRSILRVGALAGAHLTLRGSAPGGIPVARRALNVTEFGAVPGRSPQENRLALAKAIAAVPPGGTLVIPDAGGKDLEVEAPAGLTSAITIPYAMTIEVVGKIKAVWPSSRRAAMHLLRVVGDGVSILGNGSLAGPGDIDDANVGDDASYSSLIHVTGHRFRCQGITISDVPKTGIHLWDCRQAEISATWRGGIAKYQQGRTALFGIRATGGGQHKIIGNRFERDDAGRRLITGYFAGGTMGPTSTDTIDGNFADVHEKLAYLNSDDSRVTNNLVENAKQTDIVRIIGSRNIVDKLKGTRIKGGVAIYNGSANIVRNCEFLDVDQAGIFISSEGSAHPLSHTRIVGNTIVAATSSRNLQDGVYFYLGRGGAPASAIIGNRIAAPGRFVWRSGIRIVAIPPSFAEGPQILDNHVDGAIDGLSLRRVRGADLSRNIFSRLNGGAAVLRITS